jgi:predicted metalloprotease
MRWKSGRRSTNIQDRRGRRVRRGVAGSGIGILLLILAALYFGIDPTLLLQGLDTVSVEPAPPAPAAPGPAGTDEEADFVAVVLGDTEDTWQALFAASGQRYQEPSLVLFSDSVQSACGFANAATGPFYCPGDRKVYLDLGFFRELHERFRAPGDFAQAYVIAHEVGHHVQNLLGISAEVRGQQRSSSTKASNALSVALELQADCLAGVWARQADLARNILESGDIDEGLNAANAIGDDRLQRQTRGAVVPDSFTHGSSAQRVRWFRRGLDTGDPAACDTFGTATL